ncbi:MAG: hypothetical protein OEZ13_05765 [Spirochaetia bacterium]|nr:hypothetical protein [Spirochaetia bacterium]
MDTSQKLTPIHYRSCHNQSYQRYENPETSNPTLKRIEQIEKVLNENIVAV